MQENNAPKPRKSLKLLIPAVLAALALTAFFVYASRPPGPEEVAERFMQALKNGDFDTAYELIDRDGLLQNSSLRTKEGFIALFSRDGKPLVSDYRLDFQPEINEAQARMVFLLSERDRAKFSKENYRVYSVVITTAGGSRETVKLEMVNVSGDNRARWKVDPYKLEERLKARAQEQARQEAKTDGLKDEAKAEIERLKKEIAGLEQELEAGPKDAAKLQKLADAQFYLGSLYLYPLADQAKAKKAFEAAIESLQQVLKEDPGAKGVHVKIATAALQVDRKDLAEEHLRQALAADPKDTDARLSYGMFLAVYKKDYQGAIAQWEEVLAQNPPEKTAQEARRLIEEAKKEMR